LTGERTFAYTGVYMDTAYKEKIRAFYQRHRRMPSFAETAHITGLRSKASVAKLVRRLAASDFIRKDAAGKLIPHSGFGEIRVLGLVEAGFPSPAEEDLVDTMTLDEYLVENREARICCRSRETQ
jgi:SOS-response transcriptional repressor LexA